MKEINFEVNNIEQIDLSLGMGIKKIYPPIDNLEVIPTKEEQIFTHENSYGYDKVTVKPIPEIKLQDKEATPTKETQNIVADNNYDGLNQVTIEPIPDEYVIPVGTLPITENKTYDVTNYARVSASIHPAPNLQDKSITITENGTKNIKADEEYDGLNQVKVTVEVEGKEDLTSELAEQNTLLDNQNITIDDIKKALQGKASGGETPEYTRVGYIQFTGEQTIDTGIVCTQDTKIKIVFTREKSAQHYLLGVASSDNTASVTAYLGGSWRFGNKTATKTLTANEDMVYSGIIDNSQITITGSKTTISSVNDFETIGSLILGTCRNANGSIGDSQFIGKIYVFEIWNGEEQVLKLEPVINKNGVYGFLDSVSGNFLTSITDTQLEGEV